MRTVRGDLLALARRGEFDVIIHGCNCQCRMGKGIALAVRQQFPSAYAADMRTKPGDPGKLGGYSSAEVDSGATDWPSSTPIRSSIGAAPGSKPTIARSAR